MKRGKFQGVLNIISFNRHFYVFGLIVLLLLIGSAMVFGWNNSIYWLILGGSIYGLAMPLIVSWYVYDLSGFYRFDWLKKMHLNDDLGNLNLNIHAGFDETSFIIKRILPLSELQVYDFYNAQQHTEPAIIRARKVGVVYPNTKQIDTTTIPLKDNSVDNIFLVLSLHEIRKHKESIQFLRECRRICKPNGNLVIVEHLRDVPNFLAFTIGFTHFFSKTTWLKALQEAGFITVSEMKFTPFMSIFNCK